MRTRKRRTTTPDLLAETTLLTPAETTQPLEGDGHQLPRRVHKSGDSPLSPFRQPVCEQRPPRARPRSLTPLHQPLIYQVVKVLPEGVVGEPRFGECLLKGSGFSIPQDGQDASVVEVHFTN